MKDNVIEMFTDSCVALDSIMWEGVRWWVLEDKSVDNRFKGKFSNGKYLIPFGGVNVLLNAYLLLNDILTAINSYWH